MARLERVAREKLGAKRAQTSASAILTMYANYADIVKKARVAAVKTGIEM